jgi:hypothetical protein
MNEEREYNRKANVRWREKDPRNRLKQAIRASICRAVPKQFRRRSGGYTGGDFAVEYFTGIRFPELCQHLESKLPVELGWHDYGAELHLDHIKPLSGFDLSTLEGCRQALNWNNLQLVPEGRNYSKRNFEHFAECPICGWQAFYSTGRAAETDLYIHKHLEHDLPLPKKLKFKRAKH